MYYLIFLTGLFLSIINDKRKISLLFFTLILLVLACIRYGVGTDFFAYEYLFRRLSESPIDEYQFGLDDQEVLFRVMGSFIKSLGLTYQHYLMIIALINIYYLYKICRKYSKNPTLSLLVYFSFYYFVWTFSGLRQGLTLAIGIYYLLECLENKKNFKFLIIVSILTMIHSSSIVLILLYLVAKINIEKRQLIYLSLFSLLLAVLPVGALIAPLSSLPFMDRIIPYTSAGFSLNNIFDFQTLGRVLFLSIALFFYDAYTEQGEMSKKMITIYIFSILFYFAFQFSELTAARLSLYGKILDIIILTNIYYLYKERINKLLYIGCLVCLSSVYLFKELETLKGQTGLYDDESIIIPYTNIFNKDEHVFQHNIYHSYLD